MATKSRLTTLAEEKKSTGLRTMSKDSVDWLKDKIEEIRKPSNIASTISREADRKATFLKIGMLYCFFYDPKTKSDLPYWDRFPMVLILEKYPDGFLGLNLHYLPLKFRIAFLTKLMKFALLNTDHDIKRMRISYEILTASRRFAEFRPCLKRYLISHMRSRVLTIKPDEWDVATMLPIQQFRGAQAPKVWRDSVLDWRDHMKHFNQDEEEGK
jgi:hypothetical protein